MNNNKDNITYFSYARKSSDAEDKQVASIEDQEEVLSGLAQREDLLVHKNTFSEARTAKAPGRPVFNEMLDQIQRGEARGILCWKLDRLARNFIDGGKIIDLLQRGVIKAIRTHDRVYLPADNVLMMAVEFGMANQYIRDLSVNVKRGLRSKLKKGWKPGPAPFGYLNTKSESRGENYIVKDPDRFPLLRRAWDLMLTGTYVPEQILDKLNHDWGFRTPRRKKLGGTPMGRSTLYRIFTNPFYAGLFRYNGQLHEGKHPPMITLKEFDHVQALLGRSGVSRYHQHEYAYAGTFTCGECGGAVSATLKEKILKSTNKPKHYILYYCVRARKDKAACSQRHYTNVEKIECQIAQEIDTFTILPEFKAWALDLLKREHDREIEDRTKICEAQQKALRATQRELDNLLKLRLRELIDEEEYIRERTRLKEEIVRLRQKVRETESRADHWLDLAERAFTFACHAREAFESGDRQRKREILSAAGLNCTLKDHKIALERPFWLVPIEKDYPNLEERFKAFELDNKPFTEGQKEAFAALSLKWRGVVDTVGTEIRESETMIMIPDLLKPPETETPLGQMYPPFPHDKYGSRCIA